MRGHNTTIWPLGFWSFFLFFDGDEMDSFFDELKQGSLNDLFWGNQTMQMYGIF